MRDFFLAIFIFSVSPVFSETITAEVPYFKDTIPVFYDNSIVTDLPYKPNEDGYFEFYYQQMESSLYEVLLKDLHAQKQNLFLNDWLYFQLLNNSINVIFSSHKEYMRNLFLWFMLNKSGYDTRLEFKGKEVTISVFTNDLVYGVPQSKGKGGFYIDLTSFNNQVDYKKWEPFRLNFNPNKGEKTHPFVFTISQLPKIFESRIVEKDISFTHNGKSYTVKIPLDSAYIEFLNTYPELSVLKHTELILSTRAYAALIPFLKEKTEGMDSIQKIRFIVSFCRTGFNFKKDELAFAETPYFGSSAMKVIFAPEESLLSRYVDSEDISVLFYYLSKEILNPEMILMKFGKQVSVGVCFNKKIGIPLMYNNKPYALCDVYQNDDSVEIGQMPKTLEGKTPSFLEK